MKFKFLLLSMCLLFTLSAEAATQAQLDSMRAKSLAYLISQQKGDGSWHDGQGNGIQETSMTIEALALSGITSGYVPGAAASWLMNVEAKSVDSLSRQITALAKLGVPVDDLVSQLIELKNPQDGGWGAYKGYQSSMPDTALALDAFLAAKINVASDADLNSITIKQASDGGWPYVKDSATSQSAMVPTAYGVLILSRYAKYRTSVAASFGSNITNGINWILLRKKNDGGFAEDLDFNGNNNPTKSGQVFETGLVKAALLAAKDAGITAANTSQVNQVLVAIDDFLIAKQNIDGSFGSQLLQTANATQAMPVTVLADTDNDGVPDSVEALLNHQVNVADSRDLPKGNGNSSISNQTISPPNNSADVPLPPWAIFALGASFIPFVGKRKKTKLDSDSVCFSNHES